MVLGSCTNSKNNVVNKQASEELKKEITSTWKGILPCADCEEIHYDLQLLPNGKYDETTIYIGKSNEPLKGSGTWSLSSDSMIVLSENNSKKYFFYTGNALMMRDTDGKIITSPFEEMYRLQKSVPEGSIASWNKKMLEGIHFTASGNEPFWSLDIIQDSSIHFNTMEGENMLLPMDGSEKSADADVTRYHSESAAGNITVQLFKQICIDDMSGSSSPFRVDVQVKMAGSTGYKNYQGCGRFIGDYRLNDIWALQRIGNKVIDSKDFNNGVPTIEFQLNENKMYGFGGCNRFFGNIHMEDGKIVFNQVVSTQMACPGLELESKYFRMISNKTLTYKVSEGILFLGEGDTMLVFKKVD